MSVLTLESLAEAFAKKDAEIEKLKKELAQFRIMWPMTWKDTEIMRLKSEIVRLHNVIEDRGIQESR